jgi:hypothetical protein
MSLNPNGSEDEEPKIKAIDNIEVGDCTERIGFHSKKKIKKRLLN